MGVSRGAPHGLVAIAGISLIVARAWYWLPEHRES
jgi:hypothetical protein